MDEIVINTATNSFINKSEFKCSGYGLYDLLKDKGTAVGLEIGCDIGDTSYFLLSKLNNLSLYSIDPYIDYIDWNGNNLSSREQMYHDVLARMGQFSDRFNLIRKISDDAVGEFEEESLDFIFIDGLHTYEQLSKDCKNYYSKVKTGGIFAGHDFNVIPGVNKAANEFAKVCGKEILTTECDVWYWVK